jgi:hypothetical protein
MNLGSRKITILAGAGAGILIVRAAAPTILTWLANLGVQKVPGYRGRVRRVSVDFTIPRSGLHTSSENYWNIFISIRGTYCFRTLRRASPSANRAAARTPICATGR